MYTFQDRNGENLTLRPEATASCVRAGNQHGLFYNQTQRLWTSGPMFRYERPQKGRYRQFHQVSVETVGMSGPDIDAELILLSWSLWKQLGLDDKVTLELNSLGTSESRKRYREALVTYLSEYEEGLDEDSRRRMHSNPLRVLDSKDESTRKILENAPLLHDYHDEESIEQFADLRKILDHAGLPYVINQKLVRGLDYYNKTVFEWTTDALGAQGTVCAGGRYDGLVEELGGKPVPACGFAMGLERLVLMLEALELVPESVREYADVALVAMGDVVPYAMTVAEVLRGRCPELKLVTNCGAGSFKSQMKKADKTGAAIALIIGENEASENQVAVKFLREDRPQQTCSLDEVVALLTTAG